MFKSVGKYLLFSLSIFIVFILPDFILSFIWDNYTFRLDLAFILAFIPVAFILPLIKPRAFGVILLVIFMILELVELSYRFYFGIPLNPFAFALIFKEQGEIWQSAMMTFPKSLLHVLVVLLCYGVLIYFYARSKFKRSYIALGLMIVMLSILPYKAMFKTPRIANFMPQDDRVSLYNAFVILNAYLFLVLPNDKTNENKYLPYNVTKNASVDNRNIVIILGESVNSKHIGLLGYTRDTTPKLKELSKSDKNFIAKEGISSSILTKNSLAMFFALSYEHDNINHIFSQTSNLFKLAKEAGFNIYYISNQTQAELSSLAPRYMDYIYTKEDNPMASNELGDLVLLKKMQEEKGRFQNGKNLIIFHQRNAHSPYERGYKYLPSASVFDIENVDYDTYKINSYDNAMIFNDYLISNIFNFFKDNVKIPTYIMFIPDHGEAMGGGGKWGHAFLDTQVAMIPLFSSMYNGKDREYLEFWKNSFYPTHYEVGVMIVKLLGFKVENPNMKENIFYINGVDIVGNSGYIEVIKDKDKIDFIYKNS